MPIASSKLVRALLIAGGTVSVALGVLGIVLPLLPTTPFLLLAAFCYARSSPRRLDWLLTNRWFGEYIRNYREGRGIPLREKVFTLTLLWLTIAATLRVALDTWPPRLVLLALATGVTIHVARVRTFRPDAERTRMPATHGQSVLVVEDEPDVREIVVEILEQAGYRVWACESLAAVQALLASDNPPVDLLLTDLVLPGGSGLEVAVAVGARHPHLPVLFMSGYSESVYSHQTPGRPLLQKPFTAPVLLRRVRELLGAEVEIE